MNPSLKTLGELRRGDFAETLDAELAALVDAVCETGRKGSVNIKIDVSLASKGDDRTLKIKDVIKVTAPQPELGETIMYRTADGHMSRRDPRQADIEDIAIVKDDRQVKEVG